MEMRAIAESGSLERHKTYLQAHPNKVNEKNDQNDNTFLTHACWKGHEHIVEYLLSLPNIDVNKCQGGSYSPLDCALFYAHVHIIYMLLDRNARLQSRQQNELDEFLRLHPKQEFVIRREQEEERRREEEQFALLPVVVSRSTQQRMRQGTLNAMSEEAIAQELAAGKLACGFSDDFAWPAIVKGVEEHELERTHQNAPMEAWRQEQAIIHARRQKVQGQVDRLQEELKQLKQQHDELEQRIQAHAQTPAKKDLSELLAFARRVEPIEARVVAQLEEEMSKRKFQLAALSDKASPQPKLSLLLNCMDVKEAAIAATCDLDSNVFKRITERCMDFTDRYSSDSISLEDIGDLLYCGEMMRKAEFPYGDHEVACVVCANRTAQQLINFIAEREDIDLPSDVLRNKNINGRRVIFCVTSDFSNQDKQRVIAGMDRLRELHEEAI